MLSPNIKHSNIYFPADKTILQICSNLSICSNARQGLVSVPFYAYDIKINKAFVIKF